MYISQRVSELQTQTVGSALVWSQFTKGHNSIKTVGVVRLLNLCTLSDNVLYIIPSFKKIPRRVSQLLSGCNLHTEIFKGAYFHKKC